MYDPLSSDAALKALLCRAWDWLGVSSDGYAQSGYSGDEEYLFPEWDKLLRATEELVLQEAVDAVNDIWTAVALDNEEENLLDFISESASDAFVDQLIAVIPDHPQPNARWRAAELIRRRSSDAGIQVLQVLIHDVDSYVRKRAQGAYDSLTPVSERKKSGDALPL